MILWSSDAERLECSNQTITMHEFRRFGHQMATIAETSLIELMLGWQPDFDLSLILSCHADRASGSEPTLAPAIPSQASPSVLPTGLEPKHLEPNLRTQRRDGHRTRNIPGLSARPEGEKDVMPDITAPDLSSNFPLPAHQSIHLRPSAMDWLRYDARWHILICTGTLHRASL